jgi:hypothetical protein
MRKPRSALLFFVLLVLGLSLAVPAEGLPETAYAESEAAPYASTSLCFIINFPTKRHWRGRSRIEDIESGLGALVKEIRARDIRSIGSNLRRARHVNLIRLIFGMHPCAICPKSCVCGHVNRLICGVRISAT